MIVEPSRLCGASFFVLLQEARKLRSKTRDTDINGADGLSATDLMERLLQLTFPTRPHPHSSTFSSNVSQYRKALKSSSEYLPFDDKTRVAAFDKAITSDYPKALEEMGDLVDWVIDPSHDEWLGNTMLALVAADTTIPNDAFFHANVDGSIATKVELLEARSVCLESLLLGLWHHIVTQVPNNEVGRETMQRWLIQPAVKGAPIRLDKDALPTRGETQVTVSRLDGVRSEESEDVLDAEVIDDLQTEPEATPSANAPAPDSADTPDSPSPSVVVMMGGTNNQQIGHVDTLNLTSNLNVWGWPR